MVICSMLCDGVSVLLYDLLCCLFLLFYIQVMIYLIDKVLPESYFANNLRALSGKHKLFAQSDAF